MKRITLFFVLISLQANAQSVHQAEILSYIDSHTGKRVKSGICFDLIDGAFRQWDKHWQDRKPCVRGGSTYGLEIKYEDLEPGDIILSTGEVDLYGKRLPNHIQFVYKRGDGSVLTAAQNVAADTLKESFVRIGIFDEQVYKEGSTRITLRYFRPM